MHENFEIRRTAQSAEVDLQSAPGVVFSWYCPFEKAEILEVGLITTADSGAVTTAPEVSVFRNELDGTRNLIIPDALLSVEANTPARSAQLIDLDEGLYRDFPIRGQRDYPELLLGEALEFDLTVTGVGGTATAVLFVVFTEKNSTFT